MYPNKFEGDNNTFSYFIIIISDIPLTLPIKDETMNQTPVTNNSKNRIQIGNRKYKFKLTEKAIIFVQIENVNYEMLTQVSQFFQTNKINVGAYFIEDEESHNLMHKYFKLIIPLFDIKQNLEMLNS